MASDDPVLLVEDDADAVELALHAFERSGRLDRVVVMRDGQEALDFLFGSGQHAGHAPAAQPRVILLDLHLPKVGGLEVLRRIRADARTRRIPVVILSSSREERDVVDSYNLGANSYIPKPVDFGGLVELVERLSHYWLVLNEPVPA